MYTLFNELEDHKFNMYEDLKKMGAMLKHIKVVGECGNKSDDYDSDDDSEWDVSSQIGPNDSVITEEELAELERQREARKKEMEEDGFTVISDKKKKGK